MIIFTLVNPYVLSSGNCGLPIFTWERQCHCSVAGAMAFINFIKNIRITFHF